MRPDDLKQPAIPVALIGECMIELQEVEPGRTQQSFGGDTLNTAIYMARLQHYLPMQIDYITAVGADDFSQRMVRFWEREGVRSEHVLRLPEKLPGLYYILLDGNGERRFSYWRGEAAAKYCFEGPEGEKLLRKLPGYQLIYLSGISIAILTEESRENLFKQLQHCADKGISICLDYNYRPTLWSSRESAISTYQRLLNLCSVVFVGQDELLALHAITENMAGHHYFSSFGVRESIIRGGSDGCSIAMAEEHCEVPACNIQSVVDTTAAGDAFSAAYLAARLNGCTPRQAAIAAHHMAAYVISFKGAIAPLEEMPDFTELMRCHGESPRS